MSAVPAGVGGGVGAAGVVTTTTTTTTSNNATAPDQLTFDDNTCPVCWEPTSSRTEHCDAPHPLCRSCAAKMTRCPICRKRLALVTVESVMRAATEEQVLDTQLRDRLVRVRHVVARMAQRQRGSFLEALQDALEMESKRLRRDLARVGEHTPAPFAPCVAVTGVFLSEISALREAMRTCGLHSRFFDVEQLHVACVSPNAELAQEDVAVHHRRLAYAARDFGADADLYEALDARVFAHRAHLAVFVASTTLPPGTMCTMVDFFQSPQAAQAYEVYRVRVLGGVDAADTSPITNTHTAPSSPPPRRRRRRSRSDAAPADGEEEDDDDEVVSSLQP